MTHVMVEDILAQVRAALERDDYAAAAAALSRCAADQADLFIELDDRQQTALPTRLDPKIRPDILRKWKMRSRPPRDDPVPRRRVRIIDEMEPDEAVDLLGELSRTTRSMSCRAWRRTELR